jgi:hypothetical protein
MRQKVNKIRKSEKDMQLQCAWYQFSEAIASTVVMTYDAS